MVEKLKTEDTYVLNEVADYYYSSYSEYNDYNPEPAQYEGI